ncbi:MAG: DUF4013 domain-containing protein [Brevefilum sp.]|nr:DUF4013 domain-containing protein [Brevefilum sp.]
MDFGLSFSYVFKDKEWFGKVAVPALCSLIPVVGPFVVIGWGLKATKNVIDGYVENALPKLDFGADLGRGFMAWLITAIYSLPVAIVVGISGSLFGFADGVYEEAFRVILMIVGGCFGLFGFLLALLIGLMGMAGVANYVAKGQFGAAFKFKEVFGLLKKSFVSWLLVLVGGFIAMGIIAPLGTIVCIIGALFTSAYATAVYSHLLGQAYNKSATPVLAEVEVL